MRPSALPRSWIALCLTAIAACAPAGVAPPDAAPDDVPGVDAAVEGPRDAGVELTDLAPADSADVAAPTRLPVCTSAFGRGLSRAYGRLDGRLVAIVPSQTRDCNGDPDHLHLQVAAEGSVYDVAVNLGGRAVAGVPDLAVASDDVALPGGPWVEGWHPTIAPLDYAATLHLHAGDFAPLAPADVAARLEAELRGVDRIAVFATGYGPDGAHDVHRNGGLDGALALSPEGARAHLLLFRFAAQSF